jgi:hypothetical protein
MSKYIVPGPFDALMLYGQDASSNYQGQSLKLAKQFAPPRS